MTFSGGGGDAGQAGAHGEESETARALEGRRVSDVAAGRTRGRVSAGARAVLESLDAGEDLPPLHERFGGRRRAKPLATQNMPRAPPRRRVSAKPAIPRFY